MFSQTLSIVAAEWTKPACQTIPGTSNGEGRNHQQMHHSCVE